MIIGIDASRANKANRTGVEWYSFYVIEELKKITGEGVRVILYTNEKLKDGLENLPKLPPMPEGGRSDVNLTGGVGEWQEKILNWPPKYLWTQIRLWWELVKNPPDVLYVPAHTIPFLPIPRKIKVVVTIHDVGFKRFPELYKKIQFWYHDLTMKKIRKRADLILTISEFSKQEIVELYGVEPEKIQVTYLGYDRTRYKKSAEDKVILQKHKIQRPYLLFSGRLERKKNIINIIKSFVAVKACLRRQASHPALKLVLVGSPGYEFGNCQELIAASGLASEIILPGYVPEAELPAILAGAAIFLFPTLYEGFGLPIIQAMACGVPVITSDLPPHKEVAGEAALFVDPQKPEKIAEGIIEILNDQNLKNNLIEKGLVRVDLFSWPKTAEETLKLLINPNDK